MPNRADLVARGLSPLHERAIQMVAEDRLPYREIARRLGMSEDLLRTWRKQTKFRNEVTRAQERMTAAVGQRYLASKAGLIQAQINRLQAHYALMAARAEAYADDPDVVGGDTGLVTKTIKMSPSGHHAVEYVYDSQFQRAISELEEKLARLGGQWVEQSAHLEVTITDQLTEEQRQRVRAALTGRVIESTATVIEG